MSSRKLFGGPVLGFLLAIILAMAPERAAAQSSNSSSQVKLDGIMVEAASKFGLNVRDFFTVCIGKQKICSKDGKIISAYTGDFGSIRVAGGPKVPKYGNMLFIRGNLTPEPKGVFKLLVGSKFTDGILSHVPRMNGDVLLGSKLPGKLGKAVTEKYAGRIIVDGGVQFLARAQIGGVVGEILKFLGFPKGEVLLRAGRELAKGPGGLIAGGGRANPKDPDGKNIPNGFIEVRVPGVWKNPFNFSNTSLRETLIFADQEGVIRIEGIMSFNDDKRRPKREFMVLLEMPALAGKKGPAAYAWAMRRMKLGFASKEVTLKDVMKLATSMATAGAYSSVNPFKSYSNMIAPIKKLTGLLPDFVSIKNPKWDSKAVMASAPFPTAKYFNILFLSYLASHKVEVQKTVTTVSADGERITSAAGPKVMKNTSGPHLQILGNLEVLGLDLPGIDFAIGPNVKGVVRLDAYLGGKK